MNGSSHITENDRLQFDNFSRQQKAKALYGYLVEGKDMGRLGVEIFGNNGQPSQAVSLVMRAYGFDSKGNPRNRGAVGRENWRITFDDIYDLVAEYEDGFEWDENGESVMQWLWQRAQYNSQELQGMSASQRQAGFGADFAQMERNQRTVRQSGKKKSMAERMSERLENSVENMFDSGSKRGAADPYQQNFAQGESGRRQSGKKRGIKWFRDIVLGFVLMLLEFCYAQDRLSDGRMVGALLVMAAIYLFTVCFARFEFHVFTVFLTIVLWLVAYTLWSMPDQKFIAGVVTAVIGAALIVRPLDN